MKISDDFEHLSRKIDKELTKVIYQVFGRVKENSRQQLKYEVCNIYNMKKDIMEKFTNLDNLGNCKTKLDLLEDQIYHHLNRIKIK